MKKITLVLILNLLVLFLYSQNQIIEDNYNPLYLKFLPSDMNPSDLKPSDIPSEQVLQQMGLSDIEIREVLDFKYSKGKYGISLSTNNDSLYQNTNNILGDTIIFNDIIYPKAKIYGQDVFRNNRLSFFQKALDAKAPENYKVGSGDEVSISVWGYSEFSETLLVDERGYITPSSYGRIYVKGLTFKNMRSLIKNKFSSFLDMKNSEIDVTLSYSRVITINIVGEVYSPGSYSIPAINTAFNALIAAKGPTQLGSVRNIYIKRNGKTVDSLDVYQFLFNPISSNDIYMQDGDYLFVPPAKNVVEVQGAVNRPYSYEFKKSETVSDLIQYAGGYRTNAFKDIITLKRIEYNSIKVNDVHKDHISSTELQNGDELIINTISNKLSNVITVEGSIGVQGDYEFVKGDRLLDVLHKAKCIDEKTFLDQVYIIRLNNDGTKSHISIDLGSILDNEKHIDNILLKEYDIIRVLSNDDFYDDFFVSVKGSVRYEGSFGYGEGMNLKDILLQAGGLSQQAEGSRIEISRVMDFDRSSYKLTPISTVIKTVQIGDNLMLSDEANDFLLNPFDQVFVRQNPNYEEPKNVVLTGEVKYPGVYSILKKNETVSSLISRAGGLTRSAHLDGAIMYRRFEVKTKQQQEINIPNNLLDSILINPELANMYNLELLDIEKARKEDLPQTIFDAVYFDMHKALSKKNSKHNIVLKEGDSLIIPKRLDVVHITGDLHNIEGNSISSPFFGKRANYYVRNFAGGYSKDNKKSQTVVLYPNGISRRSLNLGLFSISPSVKPGSTIKVVSGSKQGRKKKEDIDYNKHIESVIIKITGIMSLYLLIERINNSF